MLALVLGLGAGVVYGVADFVGGLASRRSPLLPVLLISQLFGTTLMFIAFPFVATGSPSAAALGWGVAAGIAGAGGVALLYRGLALGRMSIVAPITSVNAASLPVVWGLASGERPGALAIAGVVIALTAVVLVSWSGDAEAEQRRPWLQEPGLPEAIGAGTCFGAFFIFLSFAPNDSSLWPLVGARLASLTLFASVVAVTRTSLRTSPGSLRLISAAGLLDVLANLLYLLASREGLLSLVAVLTSLYPAATVVLARVVLHERLVRLQLVGLAFAAAGVTLIAAR